MNDNLQSYRDAALAILRSRFKATTEEDALFAISALEATFNQDKDLLDAFHILRDKGRFPLFANAFLATQYRQRNMTDLEARCLLKIIETSNANPATS